MYASMHVCINIYTRCSKGGAKAPPISRDVPSLRHSALPKFRFLDTPAVRPKTPELKPETPELKPETPELKPDTPRAKARNPGAKARNLKAKATRPQHDSPKPQS